MRAIIHIQFVHGGLEMRFHGAFADTERGRDLFVRQPLSDIVPLLESRAIEPIVARTFPLEEAADALRYLIEGRPFGTVVLTI